jgi:hypothetical protein
LALLEGVDTLVVNGLRWEKPHHSHQLIPDAVAMGKKLGARRTFIIHLTHDVGLYDEANARLPEGCVSVRRNEDRGVDKFWEGETVACQRAGSECFSSYEK